MRNTWMVVVLVLGVNAIYFMRTKDSASRAHFAAKFALWMMVGFSVLGGLFIAGYSLEEPGGILGILLVSAWAVPMVVLSIFAWKKPVLIKPVLFTILAVLLIVNLFTLFFPTQYSSFFNMEGPWLGIGSFAFTVVASVYGYHANRRLAGKILLLVTLVPFFVALLGKEPMAALAGGSSAAALTPGFTAGLLMLISDWFANKKY